MAAIALNTTIGSIRCAGKTLGAAMAALGASGRSRRLMVMSQSGRLPTPNDRQLSTHPGSEPDSRLPANRGHLHARYPFKLLVAGGPLIEGILRRVMGPTKIHQALCRGGSVLRKRGGFYRNVMCA